MNISSGIMDVFFGYNMRVGDVRGATKAINEFEHLAQNAESAEDRTRYANAAVEMKEEILPKMKQEMIMLGKKLGLSNIELGTPLSKSMLEQMHNKEESVLSYIDDGDVSYTPAYDSGILLSKRPNLSLIVIWH